MMMFRMFICMIALLGSLTSTLSAGCVRGNHFVAGGAGGQGIAGPTGATGAVGATGSAGATGIPGTPGTLDFSDFFALMPPDNSPTNVPPDGPIGAGEAVSFPRNGPNNGVITRLGGTSFTEFVLPTVGTYEVQFQVSVTEAGQLMLRRNGTTLIPDSVVGRATGSSQIVGLSFVTTTSPNEFIEVINPPGNSPALIITPFASGTQPVSAHLTIVRVQ